MPETITKRMKAIGYGVSAGLHRVMAAVNRGSKSCPCGRTISANKYRCAKCAGGEEVSITQIAQQVLDQRSSTFVASHRIACVWAVMVGREAAL